MDLSHPKVLRSGRRKWWSGFTRAQQVSLMAAGIGATGAVIAAVVLALVPVLTGARTHGASKREPAGPPVRIDSISFDVTNRPTLGYVFPRRMVLTASQLASLNRLKAGSPQYNQWFTSRGGVPPLESIVKLLVEGNRTRPVQIIYMQVMDRCTRPLTGTYFQNSPAGGPDLNVNFQFNLDQALPTPQDPGLTTNYFSTHTISLRQGESQTFEIEAYTFVHYCAYKLRMTVVDGTSNVIETVSDHGRSFQVTGLTLPLTRYKALYIGGRQPGIVAPFSQANSAKVRNS